MKIAGLQMQSGFLITMRIMAFTLRFFGAKPLPLLITHHKATP